MREESQGGRGEKEGKKTSKTIEKEKKEKLMKDETRKEE